MFGAVRARILEGASSAGRATTAREAAYVPCRAALPTVSRGELQDPPVSVKLRLAPVLPLLQQRQHPASAVTAADEGRRGLAGAGWGRRVRAGRRGERAAGMLAPISVERWKGVQPEPSEAAESPMSNSTSGTVSGRSSHGLAPVDGEGVQGVGEDATTDALGLAGCVAVLRRAEDQRRAWHLAQTRPEGAREARVAVRDEHAGRARVAQHRGYEAAARSLGRGGL